MKDNKTKIPSRSANPLDRVVIVDSPGERKHALRLAAFLGMAAAAGCLLPIPDILDKPYEQTTSELEQRMKIKEAEEKRKRRNAKRLKHGL